MDVEPFDILLRDRSLGLIRLRQGREQGVTDRQPFAELTCACPVRARTGRHWRRQGRRP
jgi:hypothetical protein